MKIIITESKLNSVILKYLDENFYPDHGWVSHDRYKEEVSKWSLYDFLIDDESAYRFYKNHYNLPPYTLCVYDKVSKKLTDWFNDNWKYVFVEWFEGHTGLKVKHLRVF